MAEAMKVFLEGVIPITQPWVSSQNMPAGSAWFTELTRELGQSGFGILCLTKGNLVAPWIAFEAGAITNLFGSKQVCPYLLDVHVSQLTKLSLPYSLFNAVDSSKKGTQQLVSSIVRCLPEDGKMEERRLWNNFRAFWPAFNKSLAVANKEKEPPSENDHILDQMAIHNRILLERMNVQNAKIDATVTLFTELLKLQFSQFDQ